VAVADNLTAGFSVDDFSTLQRAIKDECGEPSLKLVLALVRLANHDADVFYKFKRTLIEQTPAAPADTVLKDVRADVDRLFAANYPLQRGKDVCFECGRLLMGVRDYAAAADFFHRSNELCGEHHVTFHNMGICYFYLVRAATRRRRAATRRAATPAAAPHPLAPARAPCTQDDFDSALECFKNSLTLRPDYAEARLWWERVSARLGVAGAAGDGDGAGDDGDDEGDGDSGGDAAADAQRTGANAMPAAS
jgi:tetratricopeptide (TPR) repeat protein